jgi:hypothetical protein
VFFVTGQTVFAASSAKANLHISVTVPERVYFSNNSDSANSRDVCLRSTKASTYQVFINPNTQKADDRIVQTTAATCNNQLAQAITQQQINGQAEVLITPV